MYFDRTLDSAQRDRREPLNRLRWKTWNRGDHCIASAVLKSVENICVAARLQTAHEIMLDE